MGHIGALLCYAVRTSEAAVDFGAGLARGFAAVLARQARKALDDPEARCAAGRTERAEFARQLLGRQADVVHARGGWRARACRSR